MMFFGGKLGLPRFGVTPSGWQPSGGQLARTCVAAQMSALNPENGCCHGALGSFNPSGDTKMNKTVL
jgi:hypothetical protein